MLACALACLATPYEPPQPANGNDESGQSDSGVDYDMAEAFYFAAEKRMGILHSSLISIQCHCLASLYERHAFRPIRAWHLAHSACVLFQAYIFRRANFLPAGDTDISQFHHIEQRLYWFCIKSER